MRRAIVALTLAFIAALTGLAWADPASAATLDQKLTLLSSFSQPTSGSYAAWNSARTNQAAFAGYSLDWSTDYCSASPDEPLGFDFRLPCWRHDFGYRNYKHVGQFPANKDRIDNAFYFDLKAKCATYSVWVRAACYSLAWTYYEAVHEFGSIVVRASDLDRARSLQEHGRGAE
jgi:Prokaryotic phospholipase A2